MAVAFQLLVVSSDGGCGAIVLTHFTPSGFDGCISDGHRPCIVIPFAFFGIEIPRETEVAKIVGVGVFFVDVARQCCVIQHGGCDHFVVGLIVANIGPVIFFRATAHKDKRCGNK